jgi:uncharacterized protein (DUF362 family)
MSRVFLHEIGDDYLGVIRKGFGWMDLTLRAGDRVAIKPNLTFPTFRRGVMTNPQAIEALIVHLKDYTDRITLCESDSGGYNRFSMDEVFRTTGLYDMAKRYGVRVVNMSFVPSRPTLVRHRWRRLSVPLPTFLLEETDRFITAPVPKVHSNTIVSLCLKNQWGVIQEPSLRLKLHPYFKRVIYEINKALPPTIAVVDGKYGLTRNGPLRGEERLLNWLLIGDNVFAADRVVVELMGIDWRRVPYLRDAFKEEQIESLDALVFNADPQAFKKEPFFLRRQWTDYPGVLTFNSRVLAYVGYESVLARPLHWLLYRFREPFY